MHIQTFDIYEAQTVLTEEPIVQQHFRSTFHEAVNMSDLFVNLTTPNGHAYSQPTGLFINNEFFQASSGQTITSLDPA